MSTDPKELYDSTAGKWSRREPNSLSDFTGRPPVFELCGDVHGKTIIDLGAGEGYCARVMASKGAESIEGIEISESMVSLARQQTEGDETIRYRQGTVTDLPWGDCHFDLAMGVFVYNYLDSVDTAKSFAEVFRVLRSGGEFVFSVPHPAFPFIRQSNEPPFYFDTGEHGYFSSRNQRCAGEIFCRDGKALAVQMVPKTLDDYFDALANAGFHHMPVVRELGVTDEMIELDRDFFAPVQDIPLHLAFRVRK